MAMGMQPYTHTAVECRPVLLLLRAPLPSLRPATAATVVLALALTLARRPSSPVATIIACRPSHLRCTVDETRHGRRWER